VGKLGLNNKVSQKWLIYLAQGSKKLLATSLRVPSLPIAIIF
jgi:hypothetical protein